MGRIVRALSEDGSILCAAIDSTDIARDIARLHGTSPVMTAAMGRLAAACSLMGCMLKSEGDTLTLRVDGKGAAGTLTAVSDYRGNVKCCAGNPTACVPPTASGALDVAGCIGRDGTLTVIKDMGLKEPYVGQIPLVVGDIAGDITEYYTVSEQLPTVCALGMVFGEDGLPERAGGYIVQLLPPVLDSAVSVLQQNLDKMDSISRLLQSKTTEEIAMGALGGLGAEILDKWEAVYYCDCSRERTEEILISLGSAELLRLADEQEETEVCCHFCGKKYRFGAKELKALARDSASGAAKE